MSAQPAPDGGFYIPFCSRKWIADAVRLDPRTSPPQVLHRTFDAWIEDKPAPRVGSRLSDGVHSWLVWCVRDGPTMQELIDKQRDQLARSFAISPAI